MDTAMAMDMVTTKILNNSRTFASGFRNMFGWFRNKEKIALHIDVDIHSHLLPGIDDGVNDLDESMAIIRAFQEQGFRKLITTPHIYQDHYPNTASIIHQAFDALQRRLNEEGVSITVEVAAEYFIDSHLSQLLEDNDEILSFGKQKFVLIETSFYTKPIIFDEVIFQLKSRGFTPVLAHPERYLFLENDLSWLRNCRDNGVKLQITTTSLVGVYGKPAQKVARRLLKEQMVDFLGSDIHRASQIDVWKRSLKCKISPQNLLNAELI